MLALGAGLAYAVYTLAGKQLVEAGLTPDRAMGAIFGAGAALLAPGLLIVDIDWVARPGGVAMALWLAVGTVAVAYLLFGRGLAALAPATVASLSLAEPLTAATLGLLVLGERPGLLGAVGAGLVLAGLVVLTRRRPARTSG